MVTLHKKNNNGGLHLHNQQINNLKRVTKERLNLTRRWGMEEVLCCYIFNIANLNANLIDNI